MSVWDTLSWQFPIDFCHIPVSVIKRSAGRSAVAAAAYRSGTKMTNEWDGMTHDYTQMCIRDRDYFPYLSEGRTADELSASPIFRR